jgi:hypothetical protein
LDPFIGSRTPLGDRSTGKEHIQRCNMAGLLYVIDLLFNMRDIGNNNSTKDERNFTCGAMASENFLAAGSDFAEARIWTS